MQCPELYIYAFKHDSVLHFMCYSSTCRAPEVLLGNPFSEAIDVWALGTIMATLSLGLSLFPGIHEYDVVSIIAGSFLYLS